jgi:hypothetical protein
MKTLIVVLSLLFIRCGLFDFFPSADIMVITEAKIYDNKINCYTIICMDEPNYYTTMKIYSKKTFTIGDTVELTKRK